MFGCIVAGRLVQTNIVQIDPSRFQFELNDANTINHIVVFIHQPFPEGYAATVHFKWPSNDKWDDLGIISNEKPSAVFKLKSSPNKSVNDMVAEITCQLGVSIDTISNVKAFQDNLLFQHSSNDQLMASSSSQLDHNNTTTTLPQRLLENLNNYISGFVTPDNLHVPIRAFTNWYDTISRKLKNDPSGSFLHSTR